MKGTAGKDHEGEDQAARESSSKDDAGAATPSPSPPRKPESTGSGDGSASSSESDGDVDAVLASMLLEMNLSNSPAQKKDALRGSPSPSPEKVLKSFDLDGIAQLIKEDKCRNVIVMVGAGMSVSAGIPDFRTPGSGLYSQLSSYGLPYPEAIFDLSFFRRNPAPFYRLAKEIFPLSGDKNKYKPTPAHYFIRLLHDKGILRRCFTQNIDSLETLAGLPCEKLVAAHGNFDSATCIDTQRNVPVDEMERAIFDFDGNKGWERLREKYGGLVKPDIVFFGENLPLHFFQKAEEDFPACDLLIVMGTSLVVQPFASLIGKVGRHCPRVLINRERVGEADSDSDDSDEYTLQSFLRGNARDGGFVFGQRGKRDVLYLGDCDDGVQELCEILGWKEDLDKLKRM